MSSKLPPNFDPVRAGVEEPKHREQDVDPDKVYERQKIQRIEEKLEERGEGEEELKEIASHIADKFGDKVGGSR